MESETCRNGLPDMRLLTSSATARHDTETREPRGPLECKSQLIVQ
jgi:hypothetical protein